mgnify:CR=1 FL=1
MREEIKSILSMFKFFAHEYGVVMGMVRAIKWFVVTYAKAMYCHFHGHNHGEGTLYDICIRCGESLQKVN